jgi:hypothetical protein
MLVAERSNPHLEPEERYLEKLAELIDTSAQPMERRNQPLPMAAPVKIENTARGMEPLISLSSPLAGEFIENVLTIN